MELHAEKGGQQQLHTCVKVYLALHIRGYLVWIWAKFSLHSEGNHLSHEIYLRPSHRTVISPRLLLKRGFSHLFHHILSPLFTLNTLGLLYTDSFHLSLKHDPVWRYWSTKPGTDWDFWWKLTFCLLILYFFAYCLSLNSCYLKEKCVKMTGDCKSSEWLIFKPNRCEVTCWFIIEAWGNDLVKNIFF